MTERSMAAGWRYAAPHPRTGLWHVCADGRALCSPTVALDLDQLLPIGRAPTRPRCRRSACAAGWESRVSNYTRHLEARERRQAEVALERLMWTRRDRTRAMWEKRGWLRPHYVYVVRLWRRRLNHVGSTAVPATIRKIERGRDGERLVEAIRVSNRFEAQLVQLELLARVDRWRREVPQDVIERGGTRVWSTRAPAITLAEVAVDLDLAPHDRPAPG